MDWRIARRVREKQKKLGCPLRNGRWSAGEDDILVENLQSYFKDNPIYNPLLLLHSDKYNQKLRRAAKETSLYSRMVEGLNRTPFEASHRLKYCLFPTFTLKKGKFSVEETVHFKKLCSIHGRNWKTIGLKLRRNCRGLYRHWQVMQATKFGKWDAEENQLLTEAVKQFAKKDKDLHNELPWITISKAIPGRNAIQCREHWMYKLRNEILQKDTCLEIISWENHQRFELVEQICRQNVNKEEDVDFDSIRKYFQETGFVVTREQVRKQWRQLKTKVQKYCVKSFSEILDEVACLVTDT